MIIIFPNKTNQFNFNFNDSRLGLAKYKSIWWQIIWTLHKFKTNQMDVEISSLNIYFRC